MSTIFVPDRTRPNATQHCRYACISVCVYKVMHWTRAWVMRVLQTSGVHVFKHIHDSCLEQICHTISWAIKGTAIVAENRLHERESPRYTTCALTIVTSHTSDTAPPKVVTDHCLAQEATKGALLYVVVVLARSALTLYFIYDRKTTLANSTQTDYSIAHNNY